MKTAVGPVVRLTPASTVFLLCDVQERFRAGIHKFGSVVGGSKRLAAADPTLFEGELAAAGRSPAQPRAHPRTRLPPPAQTPQPSASRSGFILGWLTSFLSPTVAWG